MKKYLSFATMALAVGFFAAGCASEPPAADAPAPAPQQTTAAAPMNMYGGPVYDGPPALEATAALVRAGGGAEGFTFAQALVSMLGEETVNGEVAKLQQQYGEEAVTGFLDGMTYAVKSGLRIATEAGIALPEAPADLEGTKLAETLVQAGTAPDGTFWSGYLFDKALSHDIHNQVMADINANVGEEADQITHKILNQAMYDVAHALGHEDVKLASLH